MSRIITEADDLDLPRIEKSRVQEFFEERARKIEQVGPIRAVIYQDKHADLAERRDQAEKACLMPLLNLSGREHVLDVGCGTGRWAKTVLDHCGSYHGIDFCGDLVAYARSHLAESSNCRFSIASIDDFTLYSLSEDKPFDRVLCAGVLIYLNDDELLAALRSIANTMAPGARAIFREPVGISRRLTIKDHFSDELEQTYNAIYRTEKELRFAMERAMAESGCLFHSSGDVYSDASLNNRVETQQRWIVVERKC